MMLTRLFTAVVMGLYLAAVVFLARGDMVNGAVLFSVTWAIIIGLHLLARAIEVRRTIRNLRRLDPERRRAIIQNIRPFVARTYYDQQLRIDGEPEIGAAVERYPFSPRERREQALLYWAITLVAAVVLLAQSVIRDAAMPERIVSGVVVAACIASLWFLRRKSRRLETVLEVSPFGLTEIHPDGSRRYVRFGVALQLRLNRRRSRAELAAAGAPDDFIAIDFDRLGFNRLLERVIEWGGFRPAAPPSVAPPNKRRRDADRAVIVPAPPPWSIQGLTSFAHAAVRSWPAAVAVGVALWVLRPAPRVTHFDALTVAPAAVSPVKLTYFSTQYGSYWVGYTDSMTVTIRACGAAWCFGGEGDSLRLSRDDLRPLAARVGSISVLWRSDSVHSTSTLFDYVQRFDAPARPGALPDTKVLDSFIARATVPSEAGAVFALQPIQPNPDFVGERVRGERGEIMRLLRSDTAVVEFAGRIQAPYHGVRLIVHYPDRVVRLWVMDSTHYIVRRETQFRNHLAGRWLDSLIGVD